MEYADFIRDLRGLKDEAGALFNLQQTHHDPVFRRWRHRVTALISAIENCGYSIDCSIASRLFDIATYGSVTWTKRIERYNRDLQDTVNELDTIIDHFDRYGDPKGQTAAAPALPPLAELEWPQKITLSWLFKHAPIDIWLKFAGALGAAFLIGIGFAQTGLYANIQDFWKTKPSGPSAIKEPNPTVETDARKNGARGSP